jgi:two-component system, NarL family, nitrate/nitrite response regulator NarL
VPWVPRDRAGDPRNSAPASADATARRAGCAQDRLSELETFLSKRSRHAPSKAARPVPPQTATTIRILIADGQPLFRDVIRKVLETQADFTIVGEVGDGVDAVRQTVGLRPDILLLDASIAELSRLEVLRALRQAHVHVRTILLATGLETSVMVEMLQLGACGSVPRSTSAELLFKSIRTVNGGELWIGRAAMTEVFRALSEAASPVRTPAQSDFGLTRREREILTLVIEGDTNKGIAQLLSLGRDTVKHHLTSIFNKTGMSNRLELALFARHYRLADAHKK